MRNHICLMTVLLTCCASMPVLGQASTAGTSCGNFAITVNGKATGTPDMMYLELVAAATAGTSADAFAQCQSKADAAEKAIVALGITGSQIVREMYEFSSPAGGNPYGMMQQAAAPAGTNVSQILRVKVKLSSAGGRTKLAQIISQVLDAANKSGVGIGQAPAWQAQYSGRTKATPVSYVLEDSTALREAAMIDSLERVKTVKESLAQSGIQAGQLVGVRFSRSGRGQVFGFWPGSEEEGSSAKRESARSSSPEEVTVQVSLTLTYEVVPNSSGQ